MNCEASLPIACREYEALLHRCKECMEQCRQVPEEASSASGGAKREAIRGREILTALLEEYERSYADLKKHFDNCVRCQTARRRLRHSPRAVA
jgi:hypothetical protein